MSITRIPASPQDELPILSTQEGSEEGVNEALPPFWTDDVDVVLMAIISPARTIGRTNPELHFVLKKCESFLRFKYNGDSTIAEARANTMANPLCDDEFWLVPLDQKQE
ncbi:hypothetical protein GH714_036364 [Hevea brasiliensis]|uniref:Uncharacterized protein n=1 Tax=Hevea brasiliensis TaxID=3981 RepID=A0A6A6NEQ5_HEVBR|nr:hypothetical protein GH714_036364 [Hevea brasiliensis]